MFELEIQGKTYQFCFNMGFMREVDKRATKPIEGVKGQSQNIGLQVAIAYLVEYNTDELVELLVIANKGQDPRITRQILDDYIDDEDTDIDALFDLVMESLKTSNATKKKTNMILESIASTTETA